MQTLITTQKMLAELGYIVQPTGVNDINTVIAVKKFQRNNGLKVDGVVGPVTLGKLLKAVSQATPMDGSTVPSSYNFRHGPTDKPTLSRIAIAHPLLRSELLLIYKDCTQVLTGRSSARFTHTLRTYKEQNDLYALGRTVVNPDGRSVSKPMGNIVTNAKGGQSIHNFGLAVDFALLLDADTNGTLESVKWDLKADWDDDLKSDWMEIVTIFKSYGWEWGGDWKSLVDPPHVQKDFGYDYKELANLVSAGKIDREGYVILP